MDLPGKSLRTKSSLQRRPGKKEKPLKEREIGTREISKDKLEGNTYNVLYRKTNSIKPSPGHDSTEVQKKQSSACMQQDKECNMSKNINKIRFKKVMQSNSNSSRRRKHTISKQNIANRQKFKIKRIYYSTQLLDSMRMSRIEILEN